MNLAVETTNMRTPFNPVLLARDAIPAMSVRQTGLDHHRAPTDGEVESLLLALRADPEAGPMIPGNVVERWFPELSDKAIRRGVFRSVPDLIAKIEEYLDTHNAKGTSFVWTATAEDILVKVARGRVAFANINQN